MKKILLIVTFICFHISYSQENRIEINGSVQTNLKGIGNIHILNLSSKNGAISDDFGFFQILVKTGDSILVSSIQYENKEIIIHKNHLKDKWLRIYLNERIYVLDTLKIKRHNLMGVLQFDVKNTPKDTVKKISFEMPKIGDNKVPLPIDEMDLQKPPNAAHPNLGGFGIFYGVPIKDGRYEAELRFKRELKRKKDFPLEIIKHFGAEFFTKELQINPNNIHLFIAYCDFRDLMNLYYKGETLEVIRILIEESKHFHKTIQPPK